MRGTAASCKTNRQQSGNKQWCSAIRHPQWEQVFDGGMLLTYAITVKAHRLS